MLIHKRPLIKLLIAQMAPLAVKFHSPADNKREITLICLQLQVYSVFCLFGLTLACN